EFKQPGFRLFADFRGTITPGKVAENPGGPTINTRIIRARVTDSAWVWIAAVTIPLMLIAPAPWNGYPLLQYDTGGYLARWYEGYLVPSRSTLFGLFLHLGEGFHFWPELVLQSGCTIWVIWLALRAFGLGTGPWRLVVVVT